MLAFTSICQTKIFLMTNHLQNRVSPTGSIEAVPSRGLFMGNRGGRIHAPETRTLTTRRWSSRRWICCVTSFKGRRRTVMGFGYTELFFLDEVTALAAGHRPCFECRRDDAKDFAERFAETCADNLKRVTADDMDRRLHRDRLDGRSQRTFRARVDDLPDGTMVREGGKICALREGHFLQWSFDGYQDCHRIANRDAAVEVLTPHSIVAIIRAGYRPKWHPSAEQVLSANHSNR